MMKTLTRADVGAASKRRRSRVTRSHERRRFQRAPQSARRALRLSSSNECAVRFAVKILTIGGVLGNHAAYYRRRTSRRGASRTNRFNNHDSQPANKLPPPIPSGDRHAHPPRDCLALCSDRDARRKLFAPLCRHLPKYVLMTEKVRDGK